MKADEIRGFCAAKGIRTNSYPYNGLTESRENQKG